MKSSLNYIHDSKAMRNSSFLYILQILNMKSILDKIDLKMIIKNMLISSRSLAFKISLKIFGKRLTSSKNWRSNKKRQGYCNCNKEKKSKTKRMRKINRKYWLLIINKTFFKKDKKMTTTKVLLFLNLFIIHNFLNS